MGGVYREIVPSERLVHTESFDESWYPGKALVTTVLVERGGRTTVTSTVRYESRQARDALLKTPMERGVAESYDKPAELSASTPARLVSSAGLVRLRLSSSPEVPETPSPPQYRGIRLRAKPMEDSP